MREFTCAYCGSVAIDRSRTQVAKFCSEKCRNRYNYWKRGEKLKALFVCRFNDGVDCPNDECETCGWNPAVEKKRKETLYE